MFIRSPDTTPGTQINLRPQVYCKLKLRSPLREAVEDEAEKSVREWLERNGDNLFLLSPYTLRSHVAHRHREGPVQVGDPSELGTTLCLARVIQWAASIVCILGIISVMNPFVLLSIRLPLWRRQLVGLTRNTVNQLTSQTK